MEFSNFKLILYIIAFYLLEGEIIVLVVPG